MKILALQIGFISMVSFFVWLFSSHTLCPTKSCKIAQKEVYTLWHTQHEGTVLYIQGKMQDEEILAVSKDLGFFHQHIQKIIIIHDKSPVVKSALRVIRDFQVEEIILPSPKRKNPSQIYLFFLQEAKKRNIPIHFINQEYTIENIGKWKYHDATLQKYDDFFNGK